MTDEIILSVGWAAGNSVKLTWIFLTVHSSCYHTSGTSDWAFGVKCTVISQLNQPPNMGQGLDSGTRLNLRYRKN